MSNTALSFNAAKALQIAELRDRRFKEVYDKILLRCLKQVHECCESQRSTLFRIPENLGADIQHYRVEDVINYLVVALRDDRGFIVYKVNENTLYVRWSGAVTTPVETKKTTTRQPSLPSREDSAEIDRLISQLKKK